MISVCLALLGQAASAFPRRALDIPLARSMESSLVLRAASCWNTWGEAMNILKIKGLEEETAKRFLEQAYWDLSRIPDADYRRITSQISREGLRGGTIRLHVDSWDDGEALLMMVWTPPSQFKAAPPSLAAPAADPPSSAAPKAAPPSLAAPAADPSIVTVYGAGLPIYQRAVKIVPWQTLTLGMQHNILQLCDVVKSGRIGEAYLAQYMEIMAGATEHSPRAPHLNRLSCGALGVLCGVLKVQPPAGFSKAEMDEARDRLHGLQGQGPFDMSRQICELARADISWLRKQDVLGAGSVVLYGTVVQMPAVILRPEVTINYHRCTQTYDRELTYITTDFKYLKSGVIGDTLVKTEWPLGRVPVEYVWDGPENPYYLLSEVELRERQGAIQN